MPDWMLGTPTSVLGRDAAGGDAVTDSSELTGTTYASANSRVSRLAKLGILFNMTGYLRNRRIRHIPSVGPFNDVATSPEEHS
jgi:hypothetical protein